MCVAVFFERVRVNASCFSYRLVLSTISGQRATYFLYMIVLSWGLKIPNIKSTLKYIPDILIPGSLRARYIYVALSLFVMLASTAVFGWYTVQSEAYRHHQEMEEQVAMEAALHDFSLSYQSVKYSLLEFLIQPDEQSYQLYNDSVLGLQAHYAELVNAQQRRRDVHIVTSHDILETEISNLKTVLKKVIRVRLDAEQTFPFTTIMLSTIVSQNTETLSVLNRLIHAESGNNEFFLQELKPLFEDTRYTWVRLIAEFRLLIAVRFGIFTGSWQPAFEQRVQNIYLYIIKIQQNIERLNGLNTKYELNLDIESEIVPLTQNIKQAIQGYEESILMLRTPAWRQDLLLLSNQLHPAFSRVDDVIHLLHQQEEKNWRNSMVGLTYVAKKISGSLWLLLMVCSMLTIFGYFMFKQAILIPLRDIAQALNNEALGKDVALEEQTSASEIKILNDAFHEMRKQVSSRQQRLVNILDNAAEAIITIDKDGIIETFNAAAEQLFDYKSEQVLGLNVLMLLPEDKRAVYQAMFMRYQQSNANKMSAEQSNGGYEIEVLCRQGQLVHVSIKISQTLIDDKVLYTGLVVDISEQLLIEKERQQHLAEVAHTGRLSIMGEMATGIAHELNQPLAAMALYLQGSLRRCDPDADSCKDIIKAVNASIEQVERAGDIIRKMRSFSRRESIQYEITDLNEIIRKSVDLVRISQQKVVPEPQLMLSTNPVMVKADILQIEQVLVNLIRNAIDALAQIPESKRVLKIISNFDEDGFARVFVIDSGEGVARENIDKIFDTYFTTKADGLGMGLSICRSIIEEHGGVLWYRPVKKEQGSQFCFVLPLA